MLDPRNVTMDILGLGRSPNTTVEGITALAMVVNDFEELERRKAEVK